MARAIVKATRGELSTRPNGRYTLDRFELRAMENDALKDHFAGWLTHMSGRTVRSENFLEDLLDGTALCDVLSRVEGSGIKEYHDTNKSPSHLKAFHSRDNMTFFQDACRRLALPDTVTTIEIEDGELSKVISVLVHLQEICEEEAIEPRIPFEPEFVEVEPEEEELLEDEEEETDSKRGSRRLSKRSSRRSSRRRSSRLSTSQAAAADPFQDFIEKVKAFCGCGRKTVEE